MLQSERQEKILNHLLYNDYLELGDAIEMFNSSPATINRDFNDLAGRELIERVRGGIRPIKRNDGMFSFAFREGLYSLEKETLAKKAASLIKPDQVIFVDGGTTTFHMGTCMPKTPLSLITNSLRLATLLEEQADNQADIEVSLTGGSLYKQSGILLGPNTKASLQQYHADWAFISVGGINKSGVYNTNELVVESELVMIQNADKTVVIADHSKIEKTAMCRICPLSDIDILITNNCPENQAILEEYRSLGVDVQHPL